MYEAKMRILREVKYMDVIESMNIFREKSLEIDMDMVELDVLLCHIVMIVGFWVTLKVFTLCLGVLHVTLGA